MNETELADLLVECVGGHFDAGATEPGIVHTGLAGITIGCEVHEVRDLGDYTSVSLFFYLSGAPLGPETVFASISGYERSVEAAVVTGACAWSCTVRPLLQSAVGVPVTDGGDAVIERRDMTVDGRRFEVITAGIDRVLAGDEVDVVARTGAARCRRASTSLTDLVLAGPGAPLLAGNHSYVLGTFVMQNGDDGVTEVKVAGGDWAPSWDCLAADGPEPPGAMTLLRELAVVVPRDPAVLTRAPLERTLLLLAEHRGSTHQAAGWRGWHVHGGRLTPPVDLAGIEHLEESVGPLPADLRLFLQDVAGPGSAGPGYGLRPRRIGDDLLLAEAGCGPYWVATRDGSVWVDSSTLDGQRRRVADSFTDWYAAWLTNAVADNGPWAQWDVSQCACMGVLSQVLDSVGPSSGGPIDLSGVLSKPGGMSVTAGDGGARPAGSILDPSHPCLEVLSRFGLGDAVYAHGVLAGSAQLAPDPSTPASRPAPRRRWLKKR